MVIRKPPPSRSNQAHTNVATIVKLEEEQDQQMSAGERFSAVVARFVGSMGFVFLEIALVVIWLAVNLGLLPGIAPFDLLPFALLWGIVSFEAVLLTAFVLIRQDHMNRKAEHRSHLDLQINLLSEQAATKVIQMLERMSRKMGIESEVIDPESKELAKDTVIESVSRELRDSLDQQTPAKPAESPDISRR
jgi:uncharacterized membrane protein